MMRTWNFYSMLFAATLLVSVSVTAAESIHQVMVSGVPSEQVEVNKTLSGFLPGDELNVVRIDRAILKLKEYWESKGYPQVAVSHSFQKAPQGTLTFHLNLGPPVLMAEIKLNFLGEEIPTDAALRVNQALEFKSYEIYDRDRLKEMRRSIESTLGTLNYVDSRVADVTTEALEKGIRVTFNIELGQRIIFSVYGTHYFTRSELMTLIEEQRTVGLGRDYINVILGRLRDHYAAHGFRSVQITPYTFESRSHDPRKVVYHIVEGLQIKINRILFDGNEAFSKEELQTLFLKVAPERIQARIYNEKMVEDAARSMIESLKGKGYLSAKLIAIKSTEVDSKHNVAIKFFISEGLQTRIQSITFSANRAFTQDQLIRFLKLDLDSPLNLLQLENGMTQIKQEYRNLGYLNMDISNEANAKIVTYFEKNEIAHLNFEINEGQLFYLGDYQIFGNEVTRSKVIEREIQLKKGDALSESKVLETEDRLHRLGIFSQVKIDLEQDPQDPSLKIMKIGVQEAIPGNITTGMGLRNDLGIRLFGEIAYANLWGANHAWVFGLSGNRRLTGFHFAEFNAQLSYIWPWFIFGETTFRPSLSAERRQYLEFDAETYALSNSFDHMLVRSLKLFGSFTYTLEQIRQFRARDANQNQQIRIGSVTPALRIDLRDNSLSPRKGFFALTSFEYANLLLGTQTDPVPVGYGRLQGRADYYWNFLQDFVLFTSIRSGWLRNFVSPYRADGAIDPRISIPLIKQFALGGINSMRGYVDQELNVQRGDPNRRVVNFETYMNYRSQIDIYTSQNVSFGPFFDAGNVLVDDFSFGKLRYGTGMGVHYVTPVGPVNFDWGFKLFPKTGEAANVFYFSLGVI